MASPVAQRQTASRKRENRRIQVLVIQWLQAHITLFSKYFASFPHGTCSLSDSRRYLALEEMYLPLSALIPENATLRQRAEQLKSVFELVRDGTVTLPCASFQRTHTISAFRSGRGRESTWRRESAACSRELFLLHSPLLEESFVVSFPPLTYMLKFRG